MTMAIPEAQKANEGSFKKSTVTRVLGTDAPLCLPHPAPAGRNSWCVKSTYQVLKKSSNSEGKKKMAAEPQDFRAMPNLPAY